MANKSLLFLQIPLVFLIGSVCPNQSKSVQQQQIAVMPQDALLFLADLATELMVNRSTTIIAHDQKQVEAEKLRAAFVRIVPADVEKKKPCAVAINPVYFNKFADGMQQLLASGIGAGIQAQLGTPNGTKQLCPVIENVSCRIRTKELIIHIYGNLPQKCKLTDNVIFPRYRKNLTLPKARVRKIFFEKF
jgi:hypothetical protein